MFHTKVLLCINPFKPFFGRKVSLKSEFTGSQGSFVRCVNMIQRYLQIHRLYHRLFKRQIYYKCLLVFKSYLCARLCQVTMTAYCMQFIVVVFCIMIFPCKLIFSLSYFNRQICNKLHPLLKRRISQCQIIKRTFLDSEL